MSDATRAMRHEPPCVTTSTTSEPDPDRLKMFSFQLFTKLDGAVTAGMIHLGDQLGLYTAMRALAAPCTSAELADATGLSERWVREWAYNQAAAGMIVADAERRGTMAASDSRCRPRQPPCWRRPIIRRTAWACSTACRRRCGRSSTCPTASGPASATTTTATARRAQSASSAASSRGTAPSWCRPCVPALEGVVDRLERGAVVADVGCGAGGAVLLMAARVAGRRRSSATTSRSTRSTEPPPSSRRAERTNARFVDPRVEPLPTDGSVDLITTFDCIHDMTHPQEMMHAIRRGHPPRRHLVARRHQGAAHLRREREEEPDGVADVRHQRAELHVVGAQRARRCRAGHARALSEQRAREMSEAAGFTRFRRLAVDHSVNAFYEVRP